MVTDIVFKTLAGKGSIELNALLTTWAAGVGNCQLVSLEVSYIAVEAAKVFMFGMAETSCSASLKSLAMTQTGIYFVSTAYSVGVMGNREIIPPANVSRQIRPVSSDLMMLKLFYDVAVGIDVQIAFHIHVSTVRTHYLN
jgi:hypothetical protein